MNIRMWEEAEGPQDAFPAGAHVTIHLLFQRKPAHPRASGSQGSDRSGLQKEMGAGHP